MFPGHNKYDLSYSIVQLKPTVLEAPGVWGRDNVSAFVGRNYVLVSYRGATFFALRDSGDLLWDRLTIRGSLGKPGSDPGARR